MSKGGVSLKSQYAVVRREDLDEDGGSVVPKGFLAAAMEEALTRMAADIEAKAKGRSPLAAMAAGYAASVSRWPFGTVLRLTRKAMLEVPNPVTSGRDRLMVLVDNGNVDAVVVGVGSYPIGKVDTWVRSDWEPDD